jgi:hypothetical protein
MARQLESEVEVQASPERVWEVLTDFAVYPDWNPFIVRAGGRAAPGSRLELRMRLPGRRPTTFRPRVLEAEPARRLRWLGHLLVPGLFDGDHRFTIEPAGPGPRDPAGDVPRPAGPAPAGLHRRAYPGGLPPDEPGLEARAEEPTPTRATP